MHTHFKLLLLPLLGLLTQCSSPDSAKPLTVLSSPARAKDWGPPQTVQGNGSYTKTYTNPINGKEKVTITGSREPMYFLYYPPNLIGTITQNGVTTQVNEPQVWMKSLVENQTVKWYQSTLPSDTKGSVFRTLGADLRDRSGNLGSYIIEIEGTKNQMRNWLSELRFEQ